MIHILWMFAKSCTNWQLHIGSPVNHVPSLYIMYIDEYRCLPSTNWCRILQPSIVIIYIYGVFSSSETYPEVFFVKDKEEANASVGQQMSCGPVKKSAALMTSPDDTTEDICRFPQILLVLFFLIQSTELEVSEIEWGGAPKDPLDSWGFSWIFH